MEIRHRQLANLRQNKGFQSKFKEFDSHPLLSSAPIDFLLLKLIPKLYQVHVNFHVPSSASLLTGLIFFCHILFTPKIPEITDAQRSS